MELSTEQFAGEWRSTMSETEWRTVAFAAAPAGWRVQLANRLPNDESGRRQWTLEVAGWLTQENDRGERRVEAAIPTPAGWLTPASGFGSTTPVVALYGPGENGA